MLQPISPQPGPHSNSDLGGTAMHLRCPVFADTHSAVRQGQVRSCLYYVGADVVEAYILVKLSGANLEI